MADRIDRRCFLAKGVLGAAAVGAVHASIEEKTLAAAIQDGTAQTAQAAEAQNRHSARQPALRQDRQRVAQPAVHRRQSDRRLGPQPRPDVRVQAVHVLQHRGQGLRDVGTGPGVRHQYDPAGPCLLGCGDEIQPDAQPQDPNHGLHLAGRGQDQDERRDQAAGRPGRHAAVFARRGDRLVHDERRLDRTSSGRWWI